MKKILDVISTIPLFNGLPADQLEAIKKIAIEKPINKGEFIVSEGDEGRGFFVIAEGRVKVFKVSAEGKEQILHIFGPGQPFGEVPVFAGQRFPANAQAIEKAKVLFLPRAATTWNFLKMTPPASAAVAGIGLSTQKWILAVPHTVNMPSSFGHFPFFIPAGLYHCQGQHDIFHNRQIGHQMKALKNKSQKLSAKIGTLLLTQTVNVDVINDQLAGGGGIHCPHDSQQG